MNAAIILPILISFAISAALGPVVIPLLRRLKFGQTERDDGPKSHLKKTGTPTMGGLMILAGVILTSLIYVKDYPPDRPRALRDGGLWDHRLFWTTISRLCCTARRG